MCAYEIRFQPPARRAISKKLPESVATAVIDLCAGSLTDNPHRVGKRLTGTLTGCHAARRGTYRIVYRIDDDTRIVEVLDIKHRAEITAATSFVGFGR